MIRSLQQSGSLQTPPPTGVPALTSPRAASWHRVMREATADVSMLVLGDSTGAGTTRWPYLLTAYLARQYPDWTIIYQAWDDTSKTYLSANKLMVQQGTNGRTLTLWNGSVSGQVAGYALNNVGTLTSGIGTPSVVFFNYGHNSPQVTDDYRAIHMQALLAYTNLYANALVVSIIQNPRVTADAAYAADQGKQQAIYDMSAAIGATIVDVNEAFRLYGNFASLLNSDGLHPNDTAGSPFWASLVWNAIKPTGAIAPAAPQSSTTSLWIPATQMFLFAGTPTQSIQFGNQVWALKHGENGSVGFSTYIPQAWKKQNISIYWYTDATSTNAVAWNGSRMYSSVNTTVGTYTNDTGKVVANPTTSAGKVQSTTIWARTGLNSSPVAFKIERTGLDASDVLTGDAWLIGVQIEKAY